MKSGKCPWSFEDWLHNGWFFAHPSQCSSAACKSLDLHHHFVSKRWRMLLKLFWPTDWKFFLKNFNSDEQVSDFLYVENWWVWRCTGHYCCSIWKEEIDHRNWVACLSFRRTNNMHGVYHYTETGSITGYCFSAFLTPVFVKMVLYVIRETFLNSSWQNNVCTLAFGEWFAFGSNASLVWNGKRVYSISFKVVASSSIVKHGLIGDNHSKAFEC